MIIYNSMKDHLALFIMIMIDGFINLTKSILTQHFISFLNINTSPRFTLFKNKSERTFYVN